jgi:hypothetical protein
MSRMKAHLDAGAWEATDKTRVAYLILYGFVAEKFPPALDTDGGVSPARRAA